MVSSFEDADNISMSSSPSIFAVAIERAPMLSARRCLVKVNGGSCPKAKVNRKGVIPKKRLVL